MLATQHLSQFSRGFAYSKTHDLDREPLRATLNGDIKPRASNPLRQRDTNADQEPQDQERLLPLAQRKRREELANQKHQQQASAQQDSIRESDKEEEEEEEVEDVSKEVRPLLEDAATGKYRVELVWANIIGLAILHLSIPAGLYLLYSQQPWKTFAFMIASIYMSALGTTAGAHRLWSHRSYKSKWPVQVLLLVFQTMAGQNSVYIWARDHRLHHKFSETDADPHNIERGLFFAHMGWLCCKKHPEVREKGKQIDMSDLEANPHVMFQYRHFWWMMLVFSVLVPTMIPVIAWGERFWTSFTLCFMLRYIVSLHFTWLVNSIAHHHGERPYDTSIRPCEATALLYSGIGESSHNYHHTFPYDYAASEMGRYFNLTTIFIDFCADLGLVSGRRRVSPETLLKRRQRTGDLAEEAQDDSHQDEST